MGILSYQLLLFCVFYSLKGRGQLPARGSSVHRRYTFLEASVIG